MRFLFGIVVGCLLTIGAAYVHDAAMPSGPTPVVAEGEVVASVSDGRMVNWAIVSHDVQGVNGWVRTQWAWLTAKINKSA